MLGMDTDQLASNEDYRELRCPSLTCKKFLAITDRLRRKFSAFGNELYRNNCEALYRGIERFPNLEELELYRLYDDDDDDAKASGEADIDTPIVKIASSGLNIRSLTLQNLPKAPSPSSVRELGSTMRNLKRLICCDIKFLGDVHIVFIADELQCLEELGIIFCNSGSRCCRTQYPQLSDRFVTDAGIEHGEATCGFCMEAGDDGSCMVKVVVDGAWRQETFQGVSAWCVEDDNPMCLGGGYRIHNGESSILNWCKGACRSSSFAVG